MAKGDNNLNKAINVEFKISISTENIDEIDQQIKNIKIDSKRSEEFNTSETKDEQ